MPDAGVDPALATAVAEDYAPAQLDALRISLGGVALCATLGLWFTRKLPMSMDPTEADDEPESQRERATPGQIASA